ncbi:folate-binding protein [Hyphomicrobium sp.]|uniref:CAF17-like 4Fe-4S cluster assembly/insertion protein YgfZ n=1 Tax=Hyphomicrobium sp. TaxID=82 RepID=UPI002E2FE6A5|nr:folate-binding protein [Hyphomicrobium sp.]HEX2842025.1 folate-binding protein [Hyphomicrobium sp.]
MTAATNPGMTVLADRGVVSVTGGDAGKLLGGLITNDMAALDTEPAMYAALLSPQGKILFDFLVVKTDDGFLLDVARDKAGELAKRLSMYKLRSDVAIRDVSDTFVVGALWGEDAASRGGNSGAYEFPDPRLSTLGLRILADAKLASDVPVATNGDVAPEEAYHTRRIALGVPEGGKDFVFGDTFPHEALLDQLHGVSFTKGCFVGQEVVSRMQHRATVRKRVVPVVADAALPVGHEPILVGEVEIGRLGSVAGGRGLALLRLDRVAEAQRAGTPIAVGGLPLRVEVPAFATFQIGAPHEIA